MDSSCILWNRFQDHQLGFILTNHFLVTASPVICRVAGILLLTARQHGSYNRHVNRRFSDTLEWVRSKTTHEPPQATTTYQEPPRPKNLSTRNTRSQILRYIKTVIKHLIYKTVLKHLIFCIAYYKIDRS